MKKLTFLAPEASIRRVFTDEHTRAIAAISEVTHFALPAGAGEEEVCAMVSGTEIIVSTWGMPALSGRVLDAAASLRIIIYGASSVKYALGPEVFERSITVTTAAGVNGRVVAEFTLALMTLCLKNVWGFVRDGRRCPGYFSRERPWEGVGGFHGARVGIIGASFVGREVMALARGYPCTILLYDPYVSDEEARGLGAQKCSMETLLRESEVISLHAPNLPELRGMIGAKELSLIRDGGWLINTARGALIDEGALVTELRSGRISACLDVCDPEPPAPDSPLYDCPNVVLTPHLAGAIGSDCFRLGEHCVEELRRYLRGEPPLNPLKPEHYRIMN